jgi:DDE_Tnp_1-associated/Transposase DDE domain
LSALSLPEVLATIPDPRSPRGRRHPLSAILGLVTLGLLLGRRSLDAIAQLGRSYGPPLAHALGFTRGKTPSKSSLSRTLRRLDAAAFEQALTRWIGSRLPPEAEVLNLDGKTLKGSRDGDIPGQHLIAVYAPHVQAVLGQMRVDNKTNEHKAALRLLGLLPLHGRVVTGDALFCQRDLCAAVVAAGGDYLGTVKANQRGLEVDVGAGLAFEAAARSVAAAFSPGGAVAARGPRGGDRGQGTRAAGAADVARDQHPDPAPEVARAGAGVRDHARAHGEG